MEEEENEEVEEEASKDETEIQVDERKLIFWIVSVASTGVVLLF